MENISKTGSDTTTQGIRIRVFPEYVPQELTPPDGRNYFSYRIIISNGSEDWVKLLSRQWLIINSEGDQEEVVGEGVVGYMPELSPGESFTYTSYCPLDTAWGTMEGTYQMVRKDGSTFDVKVGRFYLFEESLIDDE